MGQIDIYELLKDYRLSGDDNYFTVKEIRKRLRERGKPENGRTGLQAAQLEAFGYFEAKKIYASNIKRKCQYWRAFRLKKKHIENK